NYKQILADTTTPVSIYLRLRDIFPNSLLLESSEYNNRDNNISYICCQSIANITLNQDNLQIAYPGQQIIHKNASEINLREEVSNFRKVFQPADLPEIRVISNGLFGYF